MFLFLALLALVVADTPVSCMSSEFLGHWQFYLSGLVKSVDNDQVDCSHFDESETLDVYIEYPNIAYDGEGNEGTWTAIYNQGFEVVLNDFRYFLFSMWIDTPTETYSFCNQNEPGQAWYHRDEVAPTEWGCFTALLVDSDSTSYKVEKKSIVDLDTRLERPFKDIVKRTNERYEAGEILFTAKEYERWNGHSAREIIRQAGNGRPMVIPPEREDIVKKHMLSEDELPENFDWRDIDGENFVPETRDQASCGSCYAFGETGSMMSRIRIATSNAQKPNLSTQHVVSCNQYSQGCDGGFEELVGKFAMDFGIIEEEAMPYQGVDTVLCSDREESTRWFFDSYGCLGGYYGATNNSELAMRTEIYQNGPIGVSLNVYDDFYDYESGIYEHVETEVAAGAEYFFEETSHAVLCVGWGTEDGVDYWIVQNSWGADWGEDGFFRIVRGTDNCAIESAPVVAEYVAHY